MPPNVTVSGVCWSLGQSGAEKNEKMGSQNFRFLGSPTVSGRYWDSPSPGRGRMILGGVIALAFPPRCIFLE